MMNETVDQPFYVITSTGDHIHQGEILSNVPDLIPTVAIPKDPTEIVESTAIVHPLAVVVSQECDLRADHMNRINGEGGTLQNVLFCPIHDPENVRMVLKVRRKNSTYWKTVQQNNIPRFQYLRRFDASDDAAGVGFGPMMIDFKDYFSMHLGRLYDSISHESVEKRCRLGSVYREHLSSRFYYYQQRVGLPLDHYES